MIGQTQASHKADHDEIVVSGPDDKFRRIKLKVKDAPLNLERLVVTYGNGAKYDVLGAADDPAGRREPRGRAARCGQHPEDRVLVRHKGLGARQGGRHGGRNEVRLGRAYDGRAEAPGAGAQLRDESLAPPCGSRARRRRLRRRGLPARALAGEAAARLAPLRAAAGACERRARSNQPLRADPRDRRARRARRRGQSLDRLRPPVREPRALERRALGHDARGVPARRPLRALRAQRRRDHELGLPARGGREQAARRRRGLAPSLVGSQPGALRRPRRFRRSHARPTLRDAPRARGRRAPGHLHAARRLRRSGGRDHHRGRREALLERDARAESARVHGASGAAPLADASDLPLPEGHVRLRARQRRNGRGRRLSSGLAAGQQARRARRERPCVGPQRGAGLGAAGDPAPARARGRRRPLRPRVRSSDDRPLAAFATRRARLEESRRIAQHRQAAAGEDPRARRRRRASASWSSRSPTSSSPTLRSGSRTAPSPRRRKSP